jgi:hypothetical protein
VGGVEQVQHGPYRLVVSLLTGNLIIVRQDADHRRTVAFIESMGQWDRFVTALVDGLDEVAAVHAIDAVSS